MTHEATGIPPSWARVGAKVVCVDARWNRGEASPLRQDATYTIAAVLGPRPGYFDSKPTFCVGIELIETANPIKPIGFAIRRFRPLVTDEQREADLAQFRKLLSIRQPELAA